MQPAAKQTNGQPRLAAALEQKPREIDRIDDVGRLELVEPLGALPSGLDTYHLALAEGGGALIYEYQGEAEQGRIAALLGALTAQGIDFRDLSTRQSSLEDIFVELVGQRA